MRHKTGTPVGEPFVRRHRSFFVALFVIVPVVMMPTLLIYTIVKSDNLQKWYTLHVYCENSFGLKKGNQVSMSGIAIGHVRKINLVMEGRVLVSFDVGSRHKHLVRKDTKVRLRQRGFVGDWELDLAGGTPGFAAVEDGDTLRQERVPTMDEMIELSAGAIDNGIILLSQMMEIVSGIEAGEGTLGQIVKNDTLFREINLYVNRLGSQATAIASNMRNITNDAQATLRGVDSLLSTITDITTDVGRSGAALVDSLTAMIGTMGKSIEDVEHILRNVKAASDDVPDIMGRLQNELGEVEVMLQSLQEGWLLRGIGGGRAPRRNPHLGEAP
jgi:phospholipid/cholesterol/gamma-HCH transport system substrate-binding protein